jgi:hypothetical protein
METTNGLLQCTCAFGEEQTYTQMSENPKNLENYRSAWQQEENNMERKHTYLQHCFHLKFVIPELQATGHIQFTCFWH